MTWSKELTLFGTFSVFLCSEEKQYLFFECRFIFLYSKSLWIALFPSPNLFVQICLKSYQISLLGMAKQCWRAKTHFFQKKRTKIERFPEQFRCYKAPDKVTLYIWLYCQIAWLYISKTAIKPHTSGCTVTNYRATGGMAIVSISMYSPYMAEIPWLAMKGK